MPTTVQANELYSDGLAAFRAGDNQRCIELTQKSLKMGYELKDDALIGQALLGLCRAALRDRDEELLRSLSTNLSELAANRDDEWWLVVIAHMNAEMARMNNDFDRANRLYDESMEISQRIGSESMVATECFNKSLVALAQGQNDMAFKLLQRHFQIRDKLDDQDVDPYGLIGLVCYLVSVNKIEHAAETAFVCRRLLGARNVVPDPADEAPLNSAEELIRSSLSEEALAQCESTSMNWNCREVAHRYIGS